MTDVHETDEDVGGEVDQTRVFIPSGNYVVTFDNWWTGPQCGAMKVALNFHIVQGFYSGMRLVRWYNAHPPREGRTGQSGAFRASEGMDLWKDFVRFIADVKRGDRITLSRYKGLLINASVETVEMDRERKPLPDALRYSTIRRLNFLSAVSERSMQQSSSITT